MWVLVRMSDHGGEAPAMGHDVHEDAKRPLQGRLGDEETREEERREPAAHMQ